MSVDQSYGIIHEWSHTGAIAEGATASSTATSFGTDEAYMIDRIECFPPLTGAGAWENLVLQFVIDGLVYDNIRIDSRLCAPYHKDSKVLSIPLGDRYSLNPFENTCIKGKESIQCRATGGVSGVTADFYVRFLGVYFKGDAAVRNFFGGATYFNPEPVSIGDPVRGKILTVGRPTELKIANFKNFSGGCPWADKPKVNPIILYNWNAKATTANTALPLSVEAGGASDILQDMRFSLDSKRAVVIDQLGVVPHANSRYVYVTIAGDDFPKNYWDTTLARNMLPIGSYDQFEPLRNIEKKLIIYDEKGEVKIMDNGTVIPANGQLTVMRGRNVEFA